MTVHARISCARRALRPISGAFAIGLTLALPACQIPEQRHPEAAPMLPAGYLGGTLAPATATSVQAIPSQPQALPGIVATNPINGAAIVPAGAVTTTDNAIQIPNVVVAPAAPLALPVAPGAPAAPAQPPVAAPPGVVMPPAVPVPGAAPAAAPPGVVNPAVPGAAPATAPPGVVNPAVPGAAPGVMPPAVPVPGAAPGAMPPVAVASPAQLRVDGNGNLRVDDFYTDPYLLHLLQGAIAGNRELKVMNQEVQIASNEILARRGAYLPFVTVGGGGGVEKTSRYTRNGAVEEQLLLPPGRTFPDPLPNTRMGFNIDWQLDPWRQLRNSRDSAIQQFQAAVERRNYFVTRLVAEVAENYFELLSYDMKMLNLEYTIKLQEDSLALAKSKKDAARGTELAVQRFQAEVRKNQSERLVIQQEIIRVENRIHVLLNRYPEPIDRAKLDLKTFFDYKLPMLTAGIPAQLLQNRPDIRQAERTVASAGLDVKVARAKFYPTVTIGAGIGYEAFNPRYLFQPEAFAAGVAGNLVAPLVNKKAIQADFLTANARQLQSVYDLQRTIVGAFTDVVNRLSKVDNYGRSIELKRQQLKALDDSVISATFLFNNARAEYIEVLFAQRDMMEARMVLIETQMELLTASVNAFQALGGGSSYAPPVAVATAPSIGSHFASHRPFWKWWSRSK